MGTSGRESRPPQGETSRIGQDSSIVRKKKVREKQGSQLSETKVPNGKVQACWRQEDRRGGACLKKRNGVNARDHLPQSK